MQLGRTLRWLKARHRALLAGFAILVAAVNLWAIVLLDSWIGEPHITTSLLLSPAVSALFALALMARRPWQAMVIGFIAGSVWLVPMIPYNEWKAMSVAAKLVRPGTSIDHACTLIARFAPDCVARATREEAVYMSATSDPGDSTHVRIEFKHERVSDVLWSLD